MKLLANENFPLTSVLILKEAGFDIKSIGQDFPGIRDDEVIEYAIAENRLILTFDRDYGELIFKKGYRPQAGVIYLRWDDFKPETPGEYLLGLFSSEEIKFENRLTVIDDQRIRQRRFQ